jgi:hypothetical protein
MVKPARSSSLTSESSSQQERWAARMRGIRFDERVGSLRRNASKSNMFWRMRLSESMLLRTNTLRKSMIGAMSAGLTGRIGQRRLTPLLLAATAIFSAAAKAQGESGWTTWQNLGNVPSPWGTGPAFRLSTAVFFNRSPIIATVDPTGAWIFICDSFGRVTSSIRSARRAIISSRSR